MTFHIQKGYPQDQTERVCALYWGAFGAKLGKVLGPEARALAFLASVVDANYALCAVDDASGDVIGVAGFKTDQGALIGGGLSELTATYGVVGSTWRVPLLMLLERPVEPTRLLMDGICVGEAARGKGVGTALLRAVVDEARAQQKQEVRLDVIANNPRARALYERFGFVAQGTETHAWLEPLFGFSASTTMVYAI